jgi:hypothetical protein
MELILNAAKEKLSGQYVFLTPQEMGFEYYFYLLQSILILNLYLL